MNTEIILLLISWNFQDHYGVLKTFLRLGIICPCTECDDFNTYIHFVKTHYNIFCISIYIKKNLFLVPENATKYSENYKSVSSGFRRKWFLLL